MDAEGDFTIRGKDHGRQKQREAVRLPQCNSMYPYSSPREPRLRLSQWAVPSDYSLVSEGLHGASLEPGLLTSRQGPSY